MLQISNAGIVLDWLDCASWMDGVEQRLGKIPTREPLQRLLAGGIAGAFSRTGDIALPEMSCITILDIGVTSQRFRCIHSVCSG